MAISQNTKQTSTTTTKVPIKQCSDPPYAQAATLQRSGLDFNKCGLGLRLAKALRADPEYKMFVRRPPPYKLSDYTAFIQVRDVARGEVIFSSSGVLPDDIIIGRGPDLYNR